MALARDEASGGLLDSGCVIVLRTIVNLFPHSGRTRGMRAQSGRGRCPISAAAVRLETLEQRQLLSAVTVQIGVQRDTSIYETGIGNLSNGSGQFIVTGGEGSDEQARRGLVAFDLSELDIPYGSVVIDAALTLNLSYSYGGAADVDLYRLTSDWGEAGSDGDANEVEGAPAEQFDATWLFRFFDGAAWTSAGGDYSPGSSGGVNVDGPGAYQWSGEGIVRDVQQWLDDPAENFGWILIADSVPGSIKGFESRESSASVLRPVLEITYETPALPMIVAGRSWADTDADGLRVPQAVRQLNLTWYQGRTLFNAYGGQEYWYQSGTTQEWYFLTDTGELTRWDRTAGQLTGTRVAELDARFYHNPGLLVSSAGLPVEPYLNGATFELLNSNGEVIAQTLSADWDRDHNGVIDPESERGWYRFEVPEEGSYRVRAVSAIGSVESATLSSQKSQQVWQLKSSLGLRFQTSWYENVGFRGEKWLKADQGWVYITPSGDVYQWSGQSGTAAKPVTGTWMTSLGQAYYRDPSLILLAAEPGIAVAAESTVSGPGFGFFQPVSISGRAWQDFNGDGVRSPEDFASARQISRPVGAPSGPYLWFEVTTAAGVGVPAAQLHFYVSGNQLFQWNADTGGSALFSRIWGGSLATPAAILQAVFTAEPWQDGVALELLNSRGYIVATTSTSSGDLNGDHLVNPLTESGRYAFSGLLPGSYTVRTVSRSGWLDSTPIVRTDLLVLSQSLQQQYGFRATDTDWYNFGGRHERWFLDRNNHWFFILPDGTISQWDRTSGGTFGQVSGPAIARLSGSFYVNLELLFSPQQASVTLSAGQQRTGLNFGTLKVVDSLFSDIASELLQP